MFLIAINTLCTLAVADKFTVHINCLSLTAIKRADMTLLQYSKKSISNDFRNILATLFFISLTQRKGCSWNFIYENDNNYQIN